MRETKGLLVFCALAVCVWGVPARAVASQKDARKWEYKVAYRNKMAPIGDEELDKLGSDGWELVAVVEGGGANLLELFFKRPVRPVPTPPRAKDKASGNNTRSRAPRR